MKPPYWVLDDILVKVPLNELLLKVASFAESWFPTSPPKEKLPDIFPMKFELMMFMAFPLDPTKPPILVPYPGIVVFAYELFILKLPID